MCDCWRVLRAGSLGQCEKLSAFDDTLADAYLTSLDSSDGASVTAPGLTPADVTAALRRVTIHKAGQAVVLLCGAAYRNKGIQPLLDAVVRYEQLCVIVAIANILACIYQHP